MILNLNHTEYPTHSSELVNPDNLTEFEKYTNEIRYLIEIRKKITDKAKLAENTEYLEKELEKFENTPIDKFINLAVASCEPDEDPDCEIRIGLRTVATNYGMAAKIVRNEDLTFDQTLEKLGPAYENYYRL